MSQMNKAVVVETNGDQAQILLKVHDNCENCGACMSSELLLQVNNTVGAEVGEAVEIESENSQGLKTILVEFMLPVFSLIAGLIIGFSIAASFKIDTLLTVLPCCILLFGFSCYNAFRYDKCRHSLRGPSIKAINL